MARWVLITALVVAAGVAWRLQATSEPDVILITIDGLRADALSCYGATAATPHLDALARSGVRFSQALSTAPWNRASLSSLLTGRSPLHHQVRSPIDRLLPQLPSVAEIFRTAGYRTAALVASVELDHVYGLDRGFDSYDDRCNLPVRGDENLPLKLPSLYFGDAKHDRALREARLDQNSMRSNADTTDAALGFLQRRGRKPYFLWLGYFGAARRWPAHPSTANLLRNYPAAVNDVDMQIGRLMNGLTELGLHKRTLIVLLGDHGQSLFEHNSLATGQELYESTLHVPLIISWWGQLPHGGSVDSLVSTLDIAPTLLDLCGISSRAEFDGRSLRPLFAGDAKAVPRSLYMETYLGASSNARAPFPVPQAAPAPPEGIVRRAIRRERWKLIRSEKHALIDVPPAARVAAVMRPEVVSEELYDLQVDPQERNNLIAAAPIAGELRAELERLLAESK